MTNVNRVLLAGTLGQTPTLRQTKAGKPFCRMSLATHRRNKEGESLTQWHLVHVFGHQAEVAAEYLTKGRHVFIEGSIETSRFGSGANTSFKTWITADRVTFLNDKEALAESATKLLIQYEEKELSSQDDAEGEEETEDPITH